LKIVINVKLKLVRSVIDIIGVAVGTEPQDDVTKTNTEESRI
jgi:hypothetical protein